MTNCLFYTIFFITFLNLSFGSLRYSQIDRSFRSIYKGMLEASILTIDKDGEPAFPFYDNQRLNTYITTYLNANISRYSDAYKISTYLYDKTGDFCKHHCTEVRIHLEAKINYFVDYKKTQTFYIRSATE